ncbi:hypothetical protein [Pseudonocardia endophytica]|uniref:Uncharacterized protein n=1 Tax=Pseudonocardia endophytica TaxID=401976 RepID=A0A4R1I3R5_PSEEN|nr:hypothetical protein [Pseudonocardia endophytica]TCK27159.1 hypothetical protein EV378_3018 [Pseudonocardia endophytica]
MRDPLPHDWQAVSRHPTSEGEVRYERCRCGAHRIRTVVHGDPQDLAHPVDRRQRARALTTRVSKART